MDLARSVSGSNEELGRALLQAGRVARRHASRSTRRRRREKAFSAGKESRQPLITIFRLSRFRTPRCAPHHKPPLVAVPADLPRPTSDHVIVAVCDVSI